MSADGDDEMPLPAAGHSAATTVALLQHSHERCSGLSNRIVTYWKKLSGNEASVRAALDHYVVTKATADLAGAGQALEFARRLLPQATAEINASRGLALDRLYKAETALCNVVAQPAPPFEAFDEAILDAKSQVLEAEAELGKLLPLPDRKELLHALQPYVPLIEQAAGVAVEKVRREFDEKKPPPAPPTPKELMEAWHEGYLPAVAPSKTALRAYLEARRKSDSGAIQNACKKLLEAVIPLLVEDQAFQAPDPQLVEPLREVYKAMRRLGNRCSAGRFREADEAYQWMRESLNEVAEILDLYALQP